MNIVFDQQIFEQQEYGGISRYAYELAISLAERSDVRVSILSPIYINNYLKESSRSDIVKGLWLPRLPRTAKIYRIINLLLSKFILQIIKPDIIHQTYYSEKVSVRSGSKLVLTVYDMIHEKFSDNFSVNDQTKKLKKQAIDRADHIICISENTRRDLIDIYKIDPDKTSVVYLGFSLPNNANVSRLPVRVKPFLLYVGNRSGYKNFDRLLIAYAESKTLKSNFDLVCFGGGKFNNEELDKIKAHDIAIDQVVYVTGNDALLASYYAQAQVFIYPSLYEGFGIPPLEAMSLGCPVACSNVSSIPEVVGDAAQMFDPYNIAEIQQAIESLAADSNTRNNFIQRGLERVEIFSWKRCAEETSSIYEKVIS